MAVPPNVTAAITALQTAPPVISYTPGPPETVVFAQLRTAMLATGAIPANLPDLIHDAISASRASQIEQQVRADLLATFQRIAAAG